MISDSRQDARNDRPGLVAAGKEIEEKSFGIIDAEMGPHEFPAAQWQVLRRVIHTTGDFDYRNWIRFHPSAVQAGTEALQRGAPIFTDTRMIQTGLSPWRLAWYGCQVVTPALDIRSQTWAEQMGVTRSVAAFRGFATQLDGGIIAIGNAPTALLEVIRLIRAEGVRPALVVGVPVGFVQAEESKEQLWQLHAQPSITVLGRKGGSTVAVAILHALMEWAKN